MDRFQPLVDIANKASKMMYGIGGFSIALGIALLFIPAEDGDTTKGKIIMYSVVSFFVLMGAYVVYLGTVPAEKQPGIRALRETPGDICWAYVERQTTNGAHTASTIKLGLRSGKIVAVAIEKGNEEQRLRDVAAVAPRAAFGYDPDIAARYKQDPTSVMNLPNG